MLDLRKDIQSLTTFRRRSGDFMKQLRKSKRPVVLTVNGKAAAIVQGLEEAKKGKTRLAKDFSTSSRLSASDDVRNLKPCR